MGLKKRKVSEAPEIMASINDLESITQNPSWLDWFEMDYPERKAAFCMLYRDLLFQDELLFLVRILTLGGTLNVGEDDGLERIFARMIGQTIGVDWRLHPNCWRGIQNV